MDYYKVVMAERIFAGRIEEDGVQKVWGLTGEMSFFLGNQDHDFSDYPFKRGGKHHNLRGKSRQLSRIRAKNNARLLNNQGG